MRRLRNESIRRMYDVRIDIAIDKMTDYFAAIQAATGVVDIPPFIKAEQIVREKILSGGFNKYGILTGGAEKV